MKELVKKPMNRLSLAIQSNDELSEQNEVDWDQRNVDFLQKRVELIDLDLPVDSVHFYMG